MLSVAKEVCAGKCFSCCWEAGLALCMQCAWPYCSPKPGGHLTAMRCRQFPCRKHSCLHSWEHCTLSCKLWLCNRKSGWWWNSSN